MKESVYLMPGMGANPRIFEFLSFPSNFNVCQLSWIPPKRGDLGPLCLANDPKDQSHQPHPNWRFLWRSLGSRDGQSYSCQKSNHHLQH